MARQGRLGFWYWVGIVVLKPLTVLFTRPDWRGAQHVPTGGVILAANHISHADPIVVCDFILFGLRRAPRFLAKTELFRGHGLVARVMRGTEQIPVERNAASAAAALEAAVGALHRGETVVIYPEGTVTREPAKWPMTGKTGIARLALLSGVPVVPLAQWGAQEILDSYRSPGLHLLPRHTVHMRVGPPVDLSAYAGKEVTAEILREATETVMQAITTELETLRGERAPAVRYEHRPWRERAGTGSIGSDDGRRTA